MTQSSGLVRAAERASEQRGFLGWDLARLRSFMASLTSLPDSSNSMMRA